MPNELRKKIVCICCYTRVFPLMRQVLLCKKHCNYGSQLRIKKKLHFFAFDW